jgi:hypothetical protein
MLSPGPPIRLLDAALFEEAFFTEKEVLTFNHIVRHQRAASASVGKTSKS